MAAQSHTVFIKDEEYVLSADDILAVAKRETPRRVNAYYVEIDGRRFPPKQLLRASTRTSKPFDTGVAVRALQALGFKVVKMGPE
jgi:hypothetical protein